jgi:serine/threonine-protein kinase
MQLSRSFTLAIAGGVGAYVARELRRAIARADRSVRKEELFGKYRLTKAIASGGVGAVHEAVYCPEGGFERRVAVKLLHPHLARESAFVVGFRAEAELGSRLAHPNIVTILDFGQQNDAYFLAMEYVDGLSLQRLFKALEARSNPVAVAAW